MALQTPRSGLQRPSFGTASSPSLRASTTAASRKASLQALTGQKSTTPVRMDASELEIGDTVNVPGDMYGTVKFVGSVHGKNGKFVGVELSREFAARGKNDGDVDGTQYFSTTIPGAGIFLPVHRAEKKTSPALSLDSFPATPGTPSYSTLNGNTPTIPSKFSQTVGPGVGPGARPSSPQFKPRRPSLPRPESPLRRQTPNLAPTPARNALSSSVRGTRSTTTPVKPNLKASTSRPSAPAAQPPRPYSRANSRLGSRADALLEEERTKTPIGFAKSTSARNGSQSSVKSFSQPLRSGSRMGNAEDEVLRLKQELAERDKRLADQAAHLADMEASVKELSGLLPTEGQLDRKPSFIRDEDDASTAQLRQMLREKNEKIQILTAEFDAHRADFRSTLDSLEMASSETERVYEEQKQDLIAQIQELQELSQSNKDFDEVATQLKQLEDFVQELEEGLEDARRGEAEARGEVEFLRGEVERGRSELKREREKASAAMNGLSSSKELEQKDDEIRGLKAIIHSFSTSPDTPKKNAASALEEASQLKQALEESRKEKEALEHELEQLRRDTAVTNGHTRNESEMTATMSRSRSDTVKQTFAEHARHTGFDHNGVSAEDSGSKKTDASQSSIFCDMCESKAHDTLDCNQFQDSDHTSAEASAVEDKQRIPFHQRHPSAAPAPLSLSTAKLHKENVDPIAEEASPSKEKAAEDKWCALCEKDGHLAYECPDEQY